MNKKQERLGLRLTPELRARVQAAADDLDRSKSWLICRWIEEGLARHKPQRKK